MSESLEEKTKRVVREYIVRMRKNYETLKGISTDKDIDCPYCGFVRSMRPKFYSKNDHVWCCCWDTCRKTLPLEYSPPTEDELRKFWDWEAFLRKTRDFLKVMETW